METKENCPLAIHMHACMHASCISQRVAQQTTTPFYYYFYSPTRDNFIARVLCSFVFLSFFLLNTSLLTVYRTYIITIYLCTRTHFLFYRKKSTIAISCQQLYSIVHTLSCVLQSTGTTPPSIINYALVNANRAFCFSLGSLILEASPTLSKALITIHVISNCHHSNP